MPEPNQLQNIVFNQNMEKLTINHLAPYLPYELEAVGYHEGKPHKTKIDCTNIGYFTSGFAESKPILRPLSDLVKEIEIGGKKFVPIDYFLGEDPDLILNAVQVKDLSYIPYNLIQKLLEWHFDVFGLIGKGLAVDANDL